MMFLNSAVLLGLYNTALSLDQIFHLLSTNFASLCIPLLTFIGKLSNAFCDICAAHFGLLLQSSSDYNLVYYTDADWAFSLDNCRSTNSYCVFMGTNLASWTSSKQKVGFRSTAKSKYRALSNVVAELASIESTSRVKHPYGYSISTTLRYYLLVPLISLPIPSSMPSFIEQLAC